MKWGSHFNSFCFLDNHGYASQWSQVEWLAGAGQMASYQAMAMGTALDVWNGFLTQWQGYWQFGHLGYDLKNETEPGLGYTQPDKIGFADLGFFIPRVVLQGFPEAVEITCQDEVADPADIYAAIDHTFLSGSNSAPVLSAVEAVHNREAYLQTIGRLREHIRRGDCYEINFCLHHFAKDAAVDPVVLYEALSSQSPNPFSSYYRQYHSVAVCASPERYLMRTGNKLRSQPIKGTRGRSSTPDMDLIQRKMLENSAKDRSENVMVVDLVRNDLSKVCEEGSVEVEELFGIYTYPAVHQMISTVVGTLKAGSSLPDIVKATFPMGSMTGAPKRRVMELIDQYEGARRGLFSGAIGYVAPSGDFDFNVVIRSILMNIERQVLHYAVGGGITWQSVAEAEWDECQLKASAIKRVLGLD